MCSSPGLRSARAATATPVRVFRAWPRSGSVSRHWLRCTRRTQASARPTARCSSSRRPSTWPACATPCPAWLPWPRRSLRAESLGRPRRRAICRAASAETGSTSGRPPSAPSISCSRSSAARRAARWPRASTASSRLRRSRISRRPRRARHRGGLRPAGQPRPSSDDPRAGWLRYSLAGEASLRSGEYESVHGGFDVTLANEDPNRLVPLDTVRALEGEGRLGRIHDAFYTTTGNGTPVAVSTRFGQEIAAELTESGVEAVLLSGT